jgi:aminoglycoside phosphotransferase (APT) family kinase protein
MTELRGVLGRLEQRLGPITEGPTPLDGGITNRNYRATLGEVDCVVRLPGKDTDLLGISREAERTANAAAAELGLAPAVLYGDDECLVTEYAAGEPADAEQLRLAPEPVAAALRAVHDAGPSLPVRFWVPQLLDRYAAVVRTHGGSLPAEYGEATRLAIRIGEVLPLADSVPCHNDLLPANVLLGTADTPVLLVDWEYAGMGHRLFDLGNFAAGCELDDDGQDRLLAAYFGERPSDARRAALQLMRIMSDAREAAWGVVQALVSELEFDFEAYASRHFERLRREAASTGFEGWLDAASA